MQKCKMRKCLTLGFFFMLKIRRLGPKLRSMRDDVKTDRIVTHVAGGVMLPHTISCVPVVMAGPSKNCSSPLPYSFVPRPVPASYSRDGHSPPPVRPHSPGAVSPKSSCAAHKQTTVTRGAPPPHTQKPRTTRNRVL